mmetsp:Transcript_4350/g.5563  ORF Transcript_4350/g.5563 Transcript_4350/m.5563 type:complete len:278 (+) Transcript_4350:161-994(+)
MLLRLWQCQGVSHKTISIYTKAFKKNPCKIQHASVVGVCDPTRSLPHGSVFVTGMMRRNSSERGTIPSRQDKSTKSLERIYVTRFPCMEASDGLLLPTIQNKPRAMSEEDWEWLLQLPFGAIVFSMPGEEQKCAELRTLPSLVAAGDLDGDLYFICWNTDVVSCVSTTKRRDPLLQNSLKNRQKKDYDENWFQECQRFMTNSATRSLNRLISLLHNLSVKKAEASSRFIEDEDAVAFARAFKMSLELGKHGGKIYLPERLHCHVPEMLRNYLKSDLE